MKKLCAVLVLLGIAAFQLSAEWYDDKFPAELINARGKKVQTATALKGKIVAVYFSASWCGPCRGFTPDLVKFYRAVRKAGNVEIVFVSRDKSADDMMNYMKKDKMPWLAIPFNDPAAAALIKELRVNGIPNLAVFGKDGKLISPNGRWDVVLQGRKAVDSWLSPDYKPLTFQDWKEQEGGKKGRKGRR